MNLNIILIKNLKFKTFYGKSLLSVYKNKYKDNQLKIVLKVNNSYWYNNLDTLFEHTRIKKNRKNIYMRLSYMLIIKTKNKYYLLNNIILFIIETYIIDIIVLINFKIKVLKV